MHNNKFKVGFKASLYISTKGCSLMGQVRANKPSYHPLKLCWHQDGDGSAGSGGDIPYIGIGDVHVLCQLLQIKYK